MNKVVCGIDISGSTASVIIFTGAKNDFNVKKTKLTKIMLQDDKNQNSVHSFLQTFENFIRQENVDKIGIKGRATSGQFSGGCLSFKIEGLIQSMNSEVNIINANSISSKFKKASINTESYDIFKYQIDAFKTAYYLLED